MEKGLREARNFDQGTSRHFLTLKNLFSQKSFSDFGKPENQPIRIII
jgi:hypothetical protein